MTTVADHINIHHPETHERHLRDQIAIAELKARINVLETYVHQFSGDLDAIFTRIARGLPVKLYYRDNRVITLVAKEPADG